MAYVSRENKREKAPKILALCKEYGIKGRLSVNPGRNSSTLIFTIFEGSIDFIKECTYSDKLQYDYIQVNVYHIENSFNKGSKALEFIQKADAIMNEGNFDKSDLMTDYFHVGWYTAINIGRYNKPYKLIN